jgi:hypothetical protein
MRSFFQVAFLFLVTVSVTQSFWLTCPTGNVQTCYRMNVLQPILGEPGLNFYNALTTSCDCVDVTSQMDRIPQIQCLAKDRQEVLFPFIQVWNQLPKDRVYDLLRTFEKRNQKLTYDQALIYDPVTNYIKEICSDYTGDQLRSENYKHLNEMVKDYLEDFQLNRPELNGSSTGLVILKVFVEIPRLSVEVERNHQQIATQKTAKEAEEFRQLTLMKEKETRNKIEILEAEKVRDVSAVENDRKVRKEESEAKISKVRTESEAEQKRIHADADSYAAHKKAQDNQQILTPEYLQLRQFETFGCQNTIHYGKLPNFLVGPNLLQEKN